MRDKGGALREKHENFGTVDGDTPGAVQLDRPPIIDTEKNVIRDHILKAYEGGRALDVGDGWGEVFRAGEHRAEWRKVHPVQRRTRFLGGG